MKVEEIRKIWESDDFIDIAVEEYLKLKNSESYSEKYKYETLNDLNKHLYNLKITPDNVVSIFELLKDKNTSSDFFVDGKDLESFSKLAVDNSKVVSDTLNKLFDEGVDLTERIENLVSIISEKTPNYSIDISLIGYLLASYDSTKYPLYKNEIWKNFLGDFGIEEKFENEAEKYIAYSQVCNMLKNFFEEKGYLRTPSILDIQDFMYCVFSRNYKDLVFKISIKYLKRKAEFINELMNDDKFIDYINKLDKEHVRKFYDKYLGSEKVNKIRHMIAEKLLIGKITKKDLEEIKEEVVRSENTDILKPWNDFRILFPFYYERLKKKVGIELQKLKELTLESLKGRLSIEEELESHIVDFYGPQNFGTNHCWFAFFPKKNKTHQKSAQLFVGIYPERIEYGLYIGSEAKSRLQYKKNSEHVEDAELISLSVVTDKFKSVYNDFIKISNEFYQKFLLSTPPPGENEKEVKLNWNKPLEIKNLHFENKGVLLRQISTSLASGKHIILVGPPGTGKSELAKEICENFGVEYEFVTAVSDWSTFDTIGGYKPAADGTLYFDVGIFLKVLKSKYNKNLKWLVIDEINRADIDKAFGPLFSVLAGGKVTLNYKTNSGKNIIIVNEIEEQEEQKEEDEDDNVFIIPKDFRIIGTMNTYDKTSLYELSYAFMRRFAFIYVGIPKNITPNLVESFLYKWEIEDKNINNINLKDGLTEVWNIVNKYRPIGPAIIKDIAKFLSLEGDYTSAVILYVFPQFEGITENKIKQFVHELVSSNIKDFSRNKDVLYSFVSDFFEINLD